VDAIILEHFRMALIKLAKPEKKDCPLPLGWTRKLIKRSATKAPVPGFVK
jgi:hypothetical protein